MDKSELNLKNQLHQIIFEADTPSGKWFDILLLLLILTSVITVMLETIPSYQLLYSELFLTMEWIFTVIFSIEYVLRIYSVYQPRHYILSFFGIIDLLAILPAFLGLFFAGSHSLMIIRGLRLLRVFRIFKLANFLQQGEIIITALKASRAKIAVFMMFIMLMVCIFGSIMYLIEGNTNQGFDSIPRSVYWAIVTLTTVGYGDISPNTPLGQFIASVIMIAGYAVIAVPTGIITNQLIKTEKISSQNNTQACKNCSKEGHDDDAKYCKYCGYTL